MKLISEGAYRNSEKLKLLSFIATSDNDDSYLRLEDRSKAKLLRALYILFILCVIVISFIPFFLTPNDQANWIHSSTNVYLNIFILISLLVDYSLRWITYPVRASELSKHPLIFFPITGVSILMIISLLPSFFSMFSPLVGEEHVFIKFVNFFIVLRIIRLFMLLKVFSAFNALQEIFVRNRVLLINVIILVVVITLILSLLIYSAEGGTKSITVEQYLEQFGKLPADDSVVDGYVKVPVNDKITNFFDALYFTFITITTIGYGDIYPVTSLGRVIVILDAFVGITLFAIPSGIITGSFIARAQELYKRKKHQSRENEVQKLSIIEKIQYYNNKRKEQKSVEQSIIISGKEIYKGSVVLEKVLDYIGSDNIKKYEFETTNSVLIAIVDIDYVNNDLYSLVKLFDLKIEKQDSLKTGLIGS